MDRLNKKLIKIKEDGLYPLHMPGHKRNIALLTGTNRDTNTEITVDKSFGDVLSGAYEIDITEIDGFDNLHDAKEVIFDAEKRAASLYQSEETHFLVNGATSGILSAIFAVSKKGQKIIVARNCHVSVYNAILLNELEPIYVYPEIIEDGPLKIQGSMSLKEVEKAVISNPDACAIVITSPTYDGVLSDIAGLAKIAHEYDMPLIVDEAHGALFFMEGRSAINNGADIVINSVHKTLPALTQTALIHINGNIADRAKVRKYLKVFQTSSPSYVLMGSIDYAIEIMETEGKRLYRDFCIRTKRLKDELYKLRNIKYISKDMLTLNGAYDFDESKVLIASNDSCGGGREIYNLLREKYGLQPEMSAKDYVLLMTTLFDSDDGIDKLIDALFEIDDYIGKKKKLSTDATESEQSIDVGHEYYDRLTKLKADIGKKSQYTIFAYPPGIPIIAASEIITEEKVEEIEKACINMLDIKWVE